MDDGCEEFDLGILNSMFDDDDDDFESKFKEVPDVEKGVTGSLKDRNENVRNQNLSPFNQRGNKRVSHVSATDQMKSTSLSESREKNEKCAADNFSGIRIVNPLISSMEFKQHLIGRKMVQMSTMAKWIKNGDIEGDWVTIGVLVNKAVKKSSKGNNFSVWNLCDLVDCSKVVSLFLFGKSHEQHWKTSASSVIGLLNASFMPERDSYPSKSKKGGAKEICMTVDNPQKIMLMGVSKDFGTCKGTRKDGASCTMIVNKSEAEFCHFHLKSAYWKASAKRGELQAGFTPAGPRRRKGVMQPVMYGGKLYGAERPAKSNSGVEKVKPKLTLKNLQLQEKAKDMERAELQSRLSVEKGKEDPDSPLEKLLAVPTFGALNLLKHRNLKLEQTAENTCKQDVLVKSITPSELIKMHSSKLSTLRASKTAERASISLNTSGQPSNDTTPKLGRGFSPGQAIDLQFPIAAKCFDAKKQNAIRKVCVSGPLKQVDPNTCQRDRTSKEFQERVKRRLSVDTSIGGDECSELEKACKRTKPNIDVSSDAFLKILNKKSKYETLVNEEQLEREQKYFTELEKKESLETKMSSIMELPCKAVSCRKCKYTAFAALDACRKEGHPLTVHNAVKRFFRCKVCKARTTSLTKMPTYPCRSCHEKDYERVSMWRERVGPKLSSEQLSIRGDEQKFVNSAAKGSLDL